MVVVEFAACEQGGPLHTACGPERAIRISWRYPLREHVFRRCGASRSEQEIPADDTPPPIATTSGSKVLIRWRRRCRRGDRASPRTRRRPRRRRGPPPRHPGPPPRRARRARDPAPSPGAPRRPRARGRRARARPRAPRAIRAEGSAPSRPGSARRSRPAYGRSRRPPRWRTERAPVDHDAAADAGADRDHHEAARGEVGALVVASASAATVASLSTNTGTPRRSPRTVRSGTSASGMFVLERTSPVANSTTEGMPKPTAAGVSRPRSRRPLRPTARSARRCSSGRSDARAGCPTRRRASRRPTPSFRRRRRRSRVAHRTRGASYQPRAAAQRSSGSGPGRRGSTPPARVVWRGERARRQHASGSQSGPRAGPRHGGRRARRLADDRPRRQGGRRCRGRRRDAPHARQRAHGRRRRDRRGREGQRADAVQRRANRRRPEPSVDIAVDPLEARR